MSDLFHAAPRSTSNDRVTPHHVKAGQVAVFSESGRRCDKEGRVTRRHQDSAALAGPALTWPRLTA